MPGQPENEFRATSILDLDVQILMSRRFDTPHTLVGDLRRVPDVPPEAVI